MICISFLGLTRIKIIFSSGSNLYLIRLYKYDVFFSRFCIISCSKVVLMPKNKHRQHTIATILLLTLKLD